MKTIAATNWDSKASASAARGSLRPEPQEHRWPHGGQWLTLLALGMVLIGLIEYADLRSASVSGQGHGSIAHELIGYSNLLLIGSTILYVGHLWFDAKAVGRSASWMATLGAVGCFVALSMRWIESWQPQRQGYFPANGMVEMMALFSAAAVVIYLIMERVYRTRAAGAFVMPIVAGAVVFEIWLDASSSVVSGSPLPMLKSYWMQAHVLLNFIGYGSFAVAAAAGCMHLLRDYAGKHGNARNHGFALRSLPETGRVDDLMHRAILLGFPVFSLATLFGMLWARQAWGRYWAWDPKETWTLIVWLVYASYFYVRYVNRWSGNRMAWWAIAGFCVTAFCFVGVSLVWPGLHAYGPQA